VRDGDDENEVGLDRVEHTVREDPSETATNIIVDDSPSRRGFENPVEGVFNSLDEAWGQLRITLGVVTSGFLVLASASG